MPNFSYGQEFDLPGLKIITHKMRVRKICTSYPVCLRPRIIHVSQTFGNKLLGDLSSLLVEKILLEKLCEWTKKLSSSPVSMTMKAKMTLIFKCIFPSTIRHIWKEDTLKSSGNNFPKLYSVESGKERLLIFAQ